MSILKSTMDCIICGIFTFSNSASIWDRRAGFSSSKNIRKEGPTYRYITPSKVMAEVLTAWQNKKNFSDQNRTIKMAVLLFLYMLVCTHWVCCSKSCLHIANESFHVQSRRNNTQNEKQVKPQNTQWSFIKPDSRTSFLQICPEFHLFSFYTHLK